MRTESRHTFYRVVKREFMGVTQLKTFPETKVCKCPERTSIWKDLQDKLENDSETVEIGWHKESLFSEYSSIKKRK